MYPNRIEIYLLFVFSIICVISVKSQSFDLGINTGIGNYIYKTAEGRAYLREFPDTKFTKFTLGLQARYVLESGLLFSYNLRYFGQEMEASKVVLPPFVYDDNWANTSIKFNRIQNFIGVGYKISLNKISIVPQFEVMFSIANKFDVTLDVNEESNNIPSTGFTEPDFSIAVNEYGARASLGLNLDLASNLILALRPSVVYGEMELNVQDSSSFAGGDNKTIGYEATIGFYYNILGGGK